MGIYIADTDMLEEEDDPSDLSLRYKRLFEELQRGERMATRAIQGISVAILLAIIVGLLALWLSLV